MTAPLTPAGGDRKSRRAHRRAMAKWRRAEGCVSARTVYSLFTVYAVALLLAVFAFFNLLHRTQATCEPLRFGQHAGEQATSQVGKDFARTFGRAADKLGCGK